jgi:hypothetical protein
MVEFKVVRQPSVDGATIGNLFWRKDSNSLWVRLCWTLEDVVREKPGVPVAQWKVKGETAIPLGTYDLIVDFSNHFQKDLPHILNVPGFDGVRIHGGNKAADTEGCLLVAQNKIRTNGIQGSYSAQVVQLLADNGITKASGNKAKITYTTVEADKGA